MWICSHEKKTLRRKAVLGLEDYKDDDDDDKTVAISSHQGEFTEIRRDLRFVVYTAVLFSVLEQRLCIPFCSAFSQRRAIVLVKMTLDGASTKLVVVPAVRVQNSNLQVVTGLDKETERTFIVQECNNESNLHAGVTSPMWVFSVKWTALTWLADELRLSRQTILFGSFVDLLCVVCAIPRFSGTTSCSNNTAELTGFAKVLRWICSFIPRGEWVRFFHGSKHAGPCYLGCCSCPKKRCFRPQMQ